MKRTPRVLLAICLCLVLSASPVAAVTHIVPRAPAAGATLSAGSFGPSKATVVSEHIIDSYWYSQTVATQEKAKYSWDVTRLEQLPVNGGRDLYARIRAEGCYAAVIAMVFRNLGLQSKAKAYDPRTGEVDYLKPDPLTITLANMGFPSSDKAILSYSRDPIYMYNSYTLASDFGASYVNLDTTAKNAADKEALVAGLLENQARDGGVIVRISNLKGGTHFLVISGYRKYSDGSYTFYACDPMDRSHVNANVLLEKSASGINYGRSIRDITGLRYFKKA